MDKLNYEKTCLNCSGKTSLRQCGRCKCVSYCSTSCQKANWKEHKEFCSSYDKAKNNQRKTKTYIEPPPFEKGSFNLLLTIEHFQNYNCRIVLKTNSFKGNTIFNAICENYKGIDPNLWRFFFSKVVWDFTQIDLKGFEEIVPKVVALIYVLNHLGVKKIFVVKYKSDRVDILRNELKKGGIEVEEKDKVDFF